MRAGSDAPPAFLQAAFVFVFSAGWTVAGVNLPVIGGRLERAIAVLGFAAIPFALGRNRRTSLLPPAAVSLGLAGLLGTYCLSFLLNGPDAYGATFVIALASRVAFVWLGYVLLQNRQLLSRSMWLLVGSSVAAAILAFWEMARFGIGIGRSAGLELEDLMGPWRSVAFYSAQAATIGAIFLIGLASSLAPSRRLWSIVTAIAVFGAAYMSYFRREFLVTIPVILAVLWLSGIGIDRLSASAILVGFVSVAAWEAARPDSVIQARLRDETGGFVSSEETRVVTALAQLSAIREEPLLGYGPGRHSIATSSFTPTSERFLGGFNIYGWLAVEGGVGCFLSYLLILAAVFKAVWRHRRGRASGPEMIWIRCGPALVTQVALWGVFGNAWDNNLAWFVIGGLLAADQVAGEARLPASASLGPSLPLRRGARVTPWRFPARPAPRTLKAKEQR